MNLLSCILYLFNYLAYTVSPARIEKMLFGTEEITEVFEIQNFSNDSLRIRVEFEDFIIDEDGRVEFLPPDSIPASLRHWTVVNPEEFFIPPQSKGFIRITFRPPKEDRLPEYYGMLIFKSQPIPTQYQPMIQIAGEIGVPVYYSLADLIIKDASFENLSVEEDSVSILFRNIGNVHLRVKGEMKILTIDERIVEKDSIPEFVVLPQKIRKVRLPIKSKLKNGEYKVRARLDYGAIQLLEGERRFIK